MSDKFNGFSQDEINKVTGLRNKRASGDKVVQSDADATKQSLRGNHIGIRRKTMPTELHQNQDKQQQQHANKQTRRTYDGSGAGKCKLENDNALENIDLDKSLSKSLEEALFFPTFKAKEKATNSTEKENVNDIMTTAENSDESAILKLPATENNVSSLTDDGGSILVMDKRQWVAEALKPIEELNLDSPFKGISLKDFETHRKMIEEQNKQKREMLHKAIEQHSLKTAAESRKIEEIKNELAKLESDIQVDVAILRKQIDEASIHFSNIEKQYMKIESQFLKAKVDLHSAAEKKELLTEHLCTVIAHNEDRKAQRLSELMEKVGLSPVDECGLNNE